MDIGQRIKKYRQSLGISREELAEKLGLSKHAIAKYEQGQRNPDGKLLIRISDALGIPISYLLESKVLDGKRLKNLLETKGISRETLSKVLNLDEKTVDSFFNDCEIIDSDQIETINKIADFFEINPGYILGETEFKFYEDDEIESFSLIFDSMKKCSNDDINIMSRDILELLFLTLYDPISGENTGLLNILKELIELLYKINHKLSANFYATFIDKVKYNENLLSKEDIELLINNSKEEFSKNINKLVEYYSNIDLIQEETMKKIYREIELEDN